MHGKGKGHGGKTLPKFLRVAGVSFLYTAVVVSVYMGILLLQFEKDALYVLMPLGLLIGYATIIPTSLYLGYRLTKKHCKNFMDVCIVCFIFTAASAIILLCVSYVILFVEKLMYSNGDIKILDILEGVWQYAFSQGRFVFVLTISFLVGVGIYWLYHDKEDDT